MRSSAATRISLSAPGVPPTAAATGRAVAVVDCASQIGSGALPLEQIPSAGLAVRGPALDALAARFRALPAPVIGRITEGTLLFDLRCLEDTDAFRANLAALS